MNRILTLIVSEPAPCRRLEKLSNHVFLYFQSSPFISQNLTYETQIPGLINARFDKYIFTAKKDSTEIIDLLKNDYKTMVGMDITKHMENCTGDYLLIEDGEIGNMKKEADYYRKNASRIIERKDHFDFKYIKILDNTAYAVYNLKSDISENRKLTQKNWNESTVFRKVNGKWKIALIHSTPVKP